MTPSGIRIVLTFLVVGAIVAPRGPTGPKRTLVIVTKSAVTTPRCSNERLADVVFTNSNSVSAYYAANSYGQVTMSGDVVGPYTVSVGGPACARDEWASQADAAATAAGVKLSGYDLKVYINPPEADSLCPVRGWSNQNRGLGWVNNDVCDSPHYVGHEIGHLFGERHASTSADAYGDASSIMGGNADFPQNFDLIQTSPHFNAPGLIAVGWLPANRVEIVSRSGTHKVAFLATASDNFQALKIAKSDGSGHHYFSYRRAVGFDSTLRRTYLDNTSIHSWSGNPSDNTYLVANVGDGQSWTDGRVTVTQTAHDATFAYLRVAFAR